MERIRFGAMCEKLFLKPLAGSSDDVLYFSQPRLISAGLSLSGFELSLRGCAVLIGEEEVAYLQSLPARETGKRLDMLRGAELIVLLDSRLVAEVTAAAKRNDINAVLGLKPASVATDLPLYIEGRLNTVEMIHGELLDVFGVGILVTGESGVGKSETALDLITRGHLLVADDAVAVRREGNALIGCSPSITRHFMELRGIGVIDIRAMYGAGAIKIEQEIDIAIHLEPFCKDKDYSAEQWFSCSGISVPLISLPLRQGRNISVLIEVAARNLKLKAMGIDAMAELNQRMEKSERERKR